MVEEFGEIEDNWVDDEAEFADDLVSSLADI
jgi:hypothetical protein